MTAPSRELDLSRASFDSEEMQVASLTRTKKEVIFPLTRGPINFSVLRSDGKVSHRWGVSVGKKGDAYIYCRDVKGAEKVSLHASGRQHISLPGQTAGGTGANSRFMNVWEEPKFTDEAIATFSLLFPPWGSYERFDPGRLTKDEVMIVGHQQKVVVVCFYMVDAGVDMKSEQPHFRLGELPMRPRKVLHVIALKEPQGDLLERVRTYFPQVTSFFAEDAVGEGNYRLHLQGYRAANSAFMLAFPVHYRLSSEAGS